MNGINVTFGLKMEWEKISVGAGQEGRRRCDGRLSEFFFRRHIRSFNQDCLT